MTVKIGVGAAVILVVNETTPPPNGVTNSANTFVNAGPPERVSILTGVPDVPFPHLINIPDAKYDQPFTGAVAAVGVKLKVEALIGY